MATEELIVGVPQWLAPSIDVKERRDPLGLQTTTQDRLTPHSRGSGDQVGETGARHYR